MSTNVNDNQITSFLIILYNKVQVNCNPFQNLFLLLT
nr:MAG TPA: hypothetical protein [Caudoviricetes sp.]